MSSVSPVRSFARVVFGALLAIVAAAGPAAAAEPTDLEQLMLEMINRMRTNPQAELENLVNLQYNPAVAYLNPSSDDSFVRDALSRNNVSAPQLYTQWQSLTPVQPVAWNSELSDSALRYSNLMISRNEQSHYLDGLGLIERFAADGYDINQTGGSIGENIFAYAQSPFHAHAAFAIDWGTSGIQNPPSHRDLIMDGAMREVGLAFVEDHTAPNLGPFVVTQHFGYQQSIPGSFLTGVVYHDNDGNDFYSPSEGLGGIEIVATRSPGGRQYSTTTWASGGYSLRLPAGFTYDIVATGVGLGTAAVDDVTIGTKNVKIDFLPGPPSDPLAGDVNNDRVVDRADLGPLTRGYGLGLADWPDGDVSGDGLVSLRDLAIVSRHFGPGPPDSPLAVPEPSTLALATLAMLLSVGRCGLLRRASAAE